MQRRTFLNTAACIGACATLLSPATRLLAASPSRPFGLTLLKLDETLGCVNAAICTPFIGDVSIRTSGLWKTPALQNFVMRAWFAADGGSRAFDFASAGASGRSSDFSFNVRAERLTHLEAHASGRNDIRRPASASYVTTSPHGGYLAPGRFWLVLHPGDIAVARHDHGDVLARIYLQVSERDA
jgi:hypothetical protein